MSQFDKLIELIKQNIDKIELEKVTELFEIKIGNGKNNKTYILENPGDYPVYSGSTENDGEMGRVNTYDYDGEFLTWTVYGEYAGIFFHRNGKFSMNQACGLLKAKTNNNIKYIKYVLEGMAKKYVNDDCPIPKLTSNIISNILLPIPPIHIQNQIVEFLSSFSENKNSLIQSITKEIELRKQQYNYYHNLLLKENSNKQNSLLIEYKFLSDLFEVKMGSGKYTKEYILKNPGDYPVYSGATKNDGEMGRINTYDYDGEFLTWTACGENVGTFFYRNSKFSMNQACGLLKAKTNNNIKYIKYILEAVAKKYVNSSCAVPNLGSNVISNILIPIPPIHIQNQIVEILDEFQQTNLNLNKSLNENIVLTDKQFNLYQKGIINILLDKRERERDELIILINYWMQNALYENQEFLVSDLFEVKRGNSKYSKEYILKNPGDYPVYSSATKNDGELGKINTYDYDGEFLTATLNGDAGHVFYRNGKFSINSDSCVLQTKSNKINIKYFYFFLSHIAIKHRNENGGRPKLPLTNLKDISLRIPPINIQNKIVEFLSDFDENNNSLINSMDNEIELRKKQFGIYQKSIIDVLLDKRERERRINHSD